MTRRVSLASLAALMLLGVLAPGVRADHGTEGARDVSDSCPSEQVPSNDFADLTGWDQGFVDAVDCIVAYGITQGTSATTYSPGDPVARGQMASFLMRMLDAVDDYSRPSTAPDAFPDDSGSVHHANINAAAAEKIATGFIDGTFRPGLAVSRAQMASFVFRALTRAGASLPASPPDAFPDDAGSAHEPAINALAEIHVVVGDTSGSYGPNRPVTRAQMALFLTRGIDYLVAEQRLTPPFDPAAPRNVVASVLSATSIRVTWDPPTEGTPESYNVYRVTAPGGGDCPSTGPHKVDAVSAAAGGGLHFDDTGLQKGTTYCYRVTAVDDGKESAMSAPATTARATTPSGTQIVTAVVDTGADTVTLTYTEGVTCLAATASQFSFAGATSSTPSGIDCNGSKTVVLSFADATGGGDLTYRQSVDQPAIRVKSAGPDGAYAVSPQTVSVTDPPPNIDSANADTGANTVIVSYSELVTCDAGSKGQFTFTGATSQVPSSISGCVDAEGEPTPTKTVTLTFTNLTGPGTLTYTQSSDPEFRITDAGGNHAVSPKSVLDQLPTMVAAVSDSGANSVTVTYSEPVSCVDGSKGQFSYTGADPEVPTAASCSGSALTLSFTKVLGAGGLTYTQDADSGARVKDKAGQDAQNGQKVESDDKPKMTFGAFSVADNAVTLTYSEPVTCVEATKSRFTYTGAGAAPTAVTCDGTSTVVLKFAVVNGDGDATYSAGAAPVSDLAGNDAIAPQTLDVIRPQITAVVVDTDTDPGTATVTYSEAVVCPTGSHSQFTYTGATPQGAISIECSDSTVTLAFDDIGGPGELTYAPSSTASLHLRDATGNHARPQSGLTDSKPAMSTATLSGTTNIVVTYGEAVTCTATRAAQFVYDLPAGSDPTPTGISCTGQTVTLTFASPLVAGGTIRYTQDAADPSVRLKDSALNDAISPDSRSLSAA